MKPLRIHRGQLVPLDRPNVDTDQIIPKQFLKRIERTGYGEFLFYDWRRTNSGDPNPGFVLNAPQYKEASILLARRNFGCGSSREHAVWALLDFGFRVVIAPSFADIFHSNASKNGLLTITLPAQTVDELFKHAIAPSPCELTIDVEALSLSDDHGWHTSFPMDPFRKKCLLEGLDDIALTLEHESAITAYEQRAKRY